MLWRRQSYDRIIIHIFLLFKILDGRFGNQLFNYAFNFSCISQTTFKIKCSENLSALHALSKQTFKLINELILSTGCPKGF